MPAAPVSDRMTAAGPKPMKGSASMLKKLGLFIVVFVLAVGVRSLESQGLRNFDLGIRAATLGGAFVARADDVSAVFYNPAGIAFLPGFRFKTNISYLQVATTAEVPGLERVYTGKVQQLRGSHYITLNIKGRIGFGIGGFAPDTMETDWPEMWPGQTLAISSELECLTFRPAVAVKVSDFFAVGAGVDFVFARQYWKYERVFASEVAYPGYIFPTNSQTNVRAKGVGFVFGFLFNFGDRFRIGGRYQPKVELDFAGKTRFYYLDVWRLYFNETYETNSSLTKPEEIAFGIMVVPLNRLSLQLDFQLTGLREIRQWLFDIDPALYDDFEDFFEWRPDEAVTGVDLDLKNTARLMIGIEYVLKNSIALRAGYTFQRSSLEDERLHPVFPDLDTRILSFGIGYEGPLFSFYREDRRIGGLSVDACFQYGGAPGRSSALVDFPAAYSAKRWNVGVGVGFGF